MNKLPDPDDLRVFAFVVRKASFSSAAKDLGTSLAYISKRIRLLEKNLGVKLLHRTTRQLAVTEEGERVFLWAQRILDNVDQLLQEVSLTRHSPKGQLRISTSLGFGRKVLGPILSKLIKIYPDLVVRLEVMDQVIDIISEGFDLDIRVGDEIAPHLIAQRLASNYRVLCAAPEYLERRGIPQTLKDLQTHDCLIIKERDHPFGIWSMQSDNGDQQTAKVSGALSANNGEIAVQWTLAGHGVMLRSYWDVKEYLDNGQLIHILPEWKQEANIWAVYPVRLETSAKVRVTVQFLQKYFSDVGLNR